MKKVVLAIVAAVLMLALAGAAIAASPHWYKPQSPTNKQMPGNECSTTAYGPEFYYNGKSWTLRYGGGVSCVGGTGQKALRIFAQIRGRDQKTWFTLDGSLKETPTVTSNPVRLTWDRPIAAGHVYRVAAHGFVFRNGLALESLALSPGWAPK